MIQNAIDLGMNIGPISKTLRNLLLGTIEFLRAFYRCTFTEVHLPSCEKYLEIYHILETKKQKRNQKIPLKDFFLFKR